MGRSWVSQPGAALTFSVLLRPATVPASRRGWLPLLTGVAVATAVRSVTSVATTLKWPNDVLAGDRKLAGILAEQSRQPGQPGSGAGPGSGDVLVIGVGLNVAAPAAALPVSPGGLRATSLLAEGAADIAREPLLTEVLRRFERWYLPFRSDPDPARTGLLAEYRSLCATLGRHVRVELPGGRVLSGVAEDIDEDGRLLVREDPTAGVSPVSAGDIIHLR
jgi:BirA family biotin operon repressor/biotin-[acetyl-CoA-carboxylase] ligase